MDESKKNKRGLIIVTPLLVNALRHEGKLQDAAEILRRALTIIPDERALQRLTEPADDPKLSSSITVVVGSIKRLLAPLGRRRFGFIAVDGGGADVYFSEGQIGSDVFSKLSEGTAIEADISVTSDGRRQARTIRLLPER